MPKLLLFIAPIIPLLAGCAGSVNFGHTVGQDRPTAPYKAAPQEPSAPAPLNSEPQAPAQAQAPTQVPTQAPTQVAAAKMSAATVAIALDSAEKLDTDPRFNRGALLAAISTQLRSHNLIDDGDGTQADRTVEIVIDDFATRPASNAVFLGYVFSNATLAGNIRVRDAAQRELKNVNIRANSRVAAAVDGGQAQSLDPLYRRFAELTVSELTGIPVKDTEPEMPR